MSTRCPDLVVNPGSTAARAVPPGQTPRDEFALIAHWAVTRVLGEAPVEAVRLARGHPDARKFAVASTSGTRYFVKVAHLGESPVAGRLLHREIAISRQLPEAASAPRLEAALENGPWIVAVFEYVDHEASDVNAWPPAPAAALVEHVSDVYGRLRSERVRATVLWADPRRFAGFARLASCPRALEAGPDNAEVTWARSRLPRLAQLELSARHHLRGNTLLHCDLAPGNVLSSGDRLWLVDWAHGHLGNPVVDVAALLMRVSGCSVDRTDLLRRSRTGAGVTRATMVSIIAAVCGMFLSRALVAEPADVPQVTRARLDYGLNGLRWLEELM